MEDIVGQGSDDAAFATFVASWRATLDRRVEQVRRALSDVDGLSAAVLAGSLGRGEPWPLSDIDLVLIAVDGQEDDIRAAVERIGRGLSASWSREGWWTGVDAGRLLFAVSEVGPVLAGTSATVTALGDPRWFHTLDKAFQGRAIVDDDQHRGERLAAWATATRFRPDVVAVRIRQHRAATSEAVAEVERAWEAGDLLAGTIALWRAIQLTQITLMERWGLRDNSLGRFGTRFARAAAEHGVPDVVTRLDAIVGLDQSTLDRRWASVPDWVRLRHDRSFRARRGVGDAVSADADCRDTVRVCSVYAARGRAGGPGGAAPAWLGIAADDRELAARLSRLVEALDEIEPILTITVS
jgi:hypothetical protein